MSFNRNLSVVIVVESSGSGWQTIRNLSGFPRGLEYVFVSEKELNQVQKDEITLFGVGRAVTQLVQGGSFLLRVKRALSQCSREQILILKWGSTLNRGSLLQIKETVENTSRNSKYFLPLPKNWARPVEVLKWIKDLFEAFLLELPGNHNAFLIPRQTLKVAFERYPYVNVGKVSKLLRISGAQIGPLGNFLNVSRFD